ncbi:MAG: RluA family pseudouridine synthase [Candidatus Levybacteria bacterium]|nr:RluA family pseudouridine synthase [Candidatus Levybacteria bacterium]
MIEPKIIFEDDDILVLDKPPGLTVNRSDTASDETTLQDFVSEKTSFSKNDDEEFVNRGGIVHRLDKDTSGVILVAKNKEAFYGIQRQFKERAVEKSYVCLVHGEVKPKDGVINAPVGRLPWNRKRFGVLAGGREAQSNYETIKNLSLWGEKFSFLRVFPKTGRTHQIRVHMKYIGHPIFGDILYGGRKVSRSDRDKVNRLFLHAEKISFVHPVSKKRITFESRLPVELEEIIHEI